jgi:hypothetical protein
MIPHLKEKISDDDLLNAPKVLRKFIYILNPVKYDFQCLICGGRNIEWSEFESHIWCYDCGKDIFIPLFYSGIFGGPIPNGISQMIGLSFDRISIDGKTTYKREPDSPNIEEQINRERFYKLNKIFTDDPSRWEDTWYYNEELNNYKIQIDKKLYDL